MEWLRHIFVIIQGDKQNLLLQDIYCARRYSIKDYHYILQAFELR